MHPYYNIHITHKHTLAHIEDLRHAYIGFGVMPDCSHIIPPYG